MGVALVLALSVVLQFAAAMLALRLTWVTQAGRAWMLIAAAVFLMAVRRSITLLRLMSGDLAYPPDLASELVALATSILMVAGIAWIGPLFLSIKRYQKTLQQSEERYRILAERNPHGIQVIDPTGIVTYVNPAYQEMLGYTKEELLGKSTVDLLEPASKRPKLREYLSLLVKKQPEPTTYFQQNRRKDGRVIEQAVDWNYSRDGEGNVVGFISVITDITERKQAEEALRQERDFAEGLIETARVIVLVLDNQGRIVRFNPYMEEISGYRLEEVQGKDWFTTFLPERDRSRIGDLFRESVSGVRIRGNVNPIVTKDGREREIEWYDTTLKDASGDIIGVLTIGQDVTDRKRADEQLQISLKEKELLLREIHHRVKNNIQVMTGLLRLQANKIKSKPALEAFEETQNRIKALSLVHETLYGSEGPANFDLQRYVERVGKGLLLAYGRSNRSVDLLVDVRGATIGVDAVVPVGLILNELMSNCLKHAFPEKRRGRIRIGTRPAGEDNIEFSVSDDGVGLPQEIDPHNTETIGLGLVVGLAENQLGGSVEVARDGGTRFTITFGQKSCQKET